MKLKIFSLLLIFASSGAVNAKNDFEIVKQRVVSEIMETPVDDSMVTVLMNTVKEDGSWPGIDYIDVSNTGFEHRTHMSDLTIDLPGGFFAGKSVIIGL